MSCAESECFDADLAVKRNQDRFPADFTLALTEAEWSALKSPEGGRPKDEPMMSQIVTSSRRKLVAPPRAFTEQGVAMLSRVLRSPRAVQVNTPSCVPSSSFGG